MKIPPVCLMITAAAATLSIHPSRSVFFYYETVTLSCAVPGSFSSWTVKRNTSTNSSVSCETWGQLNGSSCTIKGVYPSDSGVYWCESDRGECSNTINIRVAKNNIPVTTPDPDPDPTPPIALPKLLSTILLFILYTCILILAVYTYRKWTQARAEAKRKWPDHL
ncbi:uncharacterized protein LOC109194487 isoform X3 [Oreochromis niloticus]|uniref:uncharacterized protein LOC109194487 isoform X3 n=1 Tax=Oreochromis niloticus TaxID=8128 RepID=UPI000DF3A19A|nr:uncharacterized protein LOC109194487 isoform X3 [Oreochromis niloticus]